MSTPVNFIMAEFPSCSDGPVRVCGPFAAKNHMGGDRLIISRSAAGTPVSEPFRPNLASFAYSICKALAASPDATHLLRVSPLPPCMEFFQNTAHKRPQLVSGESYARRFRRVFGVAVEIQLKASGKGTHTPGQLTVLTLVPWRFGDSATETKHSYVSVGFALSFPGLPFPPQLLWSRWWMSFVGSLRPLTAGPNPHSWSDGMCPLWRCGKPLRQTPCCRHLEIWTVSLAFGDVLFSSATPFS